MASFNHTYNALGTEGLSVTLPELIGKYPLMVFLGGNLMKIVETPAQMNEVGFNSVTGTYTFFSELYPEQVLQTLYKSI